jgi:hypothetical protein
MFLATFIWGGLALAVSMIPMGAKVDYTPPDLTGVHIPSVSDPDWGEWIGANNGANVEIFFMAAGIEDPNESHGHGHGHGHDSHAKSGHGHH